MNLAGFLCVFFHFFVHFLCQLSLLPLTRSYLKATWSLHEELHIEQPEPGLNPQPSGHDLATLTQSLANIEAHVCLSCRHTSFVALGNCLGNAVDVGQTWPLQLWLV